MAAVPTRNDRRVILHLVSPKSSLSPAAVVLNPQDYDCFYASVFEVENPLLKSLPLAVQQKQIVVTCNYEARRRGLYKLQLIKDAKRLCPDVVIVLGEDLTKFRDASKSLYLFIRHFVWGGRVERLGFDELSLDVTEMIDYNTALLNSNDLENSFFIWIGMIPRLASPTMQPTSGDRPGHRRYRLPEIGAGVRHWKQNYWSPRI
ncbi:hypothetical protein N7492_009428 [Penicillium capsulatum]|uniref:UmuC domain-containing protein n=1 Tax=Penicillium capsulatum TaxID=69766 RepID=A0A9W9LI92_9EURO|nr:hypothetical protein N7492_009428 [Penicillium capsulatum]